MTDSKSYVEYVLGLYGAMFVDIVSQRPGLRIECERDYKRLLSAIEQMGLPFVMEVLPAFGKHFDMCLSTGCLTPSGLAHFRPYRKSVVIPRLFKGLLRNIFDDNGVLRSVPDVYSIKSVRQLSMAFKRFRMECPEPKVWKQINEFFKTDNEVVPGSLNWNLGDFDSDGVTHLHFGDGIPHEPSNPLFANAEDGKLVPSILGHRHSDAIQFVADVICSQLGAFKPLEWRTRHGPGAVADMKGSGYKYHFPTWPAKLEQCFPMAEFAFANLASWASFASKGDSCLFSENEPPSRLIAVPKTYSGPRLICSEPTSGQWCQQSVRDYLMTRVQRTALSGSIDFRSQIKNQTLARVASLTGSHSTIDLSSASDRISPWLIERLFRKRPELLECFYSCRTRWVTQDIDRKSPRFSILRKFSTQGSALTFPVQTYLFTTLCLATVIYCRSWKPSIASIRRASREVQVFGDDIIVPIDCHDVVVDTLHHFRLKVNPAKTFNSGKFRESCGYDAYDGNNVTKVSVLSVPAVSAPEAVLSSVDCHNNLLNAGWFEAARFVRKTVSQLKRYAFPWVDPSTGVIGWHSMFGEDNSHLKSRWNPDLHRSELLYTVPKGTDARIAIDDDAMVLQYFTECHKPPQSQTNRLGMLSLRRPLKLRWSWAPSAS